MDHVQPKGIAVKAHDLTERRIEYLDMTVAGNLKRVASMVFSGDVLCHAVDIHRREPRYRLKQILSVYFSLNLSSSRLTLEVSAMERI